MIKFSDEGTALILLGRALLFRFKRNVNTQSPLIIRPYISGKNLHVGMIMFSYIFGSLIFGWYGIFLGPMLCVLILHFGELILPEIIGNGVEPKKKRTSKNKKN